MAYEKQTWTTGDVITQEKLNHMEDGIENAYELPAVTETDNGKFLGVEDGHFGLIEGGSGGYEIKVLDKGDYSTSPSNSTKITGFSIDKTNGNEIREAFLNGQEVFLSMDVYGDGKTLDKFILLAIGSGGSGRTLFQFACLWGRYYSYIDLSFSAYAPTYSFIEAYAATKDLWATS